MASDVQIIEEAIKLVNEGVSVTFPVNGRSMLPFIIGGRESVILEKVSTLKIGDVVLAISENRYVIHRVVKMQGDHIWLMGDGNLQQLEYCSLADVKAVATHVVNTAGKHRSLYSKSQKIASWIWIKLKPIRKWLLLLYRKIKRLS